MIQIEFKAEPKAILQKNKIKNEILSQTITQNIKNNQQKQIFKGKNEIIVDYLFSGNELSFLFQDKFIQIKVLDASYNYMKFGVLIAFLEDGYKKKLKLGITFQFVKGELINTNILHDKLIDDDCIDLILPNKNKKIIRSNANYSRLYKNFYNLLKYVEEYKMTSTILKKNKRKKINISKKKDHLNIKDMKKNQYEFLQKNFLKLKNEKSSSSSSIDHSIKEPLTSENKSFHFPESISSFSLDFSLIEEPLLLTLKNQSCPDTPMSVSIESVKTHSIKNSPREEQSTLFKSEYQKEIELKEYIESILNEIQNIINNPKIEPQNKINKAMNIYNNIRDDAKKIILNTKPCFIYKKQKLELTDTNNIMNADLTKYRELKKISINNLEIRIKKITLISIEQFFKKKYSISEKLKIVKKCFSLLKIFVNNNELPNKICSDILELHKIDQNKTQCHQLILGIKELQENLKLNQWTPVQIHDFLHNTMIVENNALLCLDKKIDNILIKTLSGEKIEKNDLEVPNDINKIKGANIKKILTDLNKPIKIAIS